MIRADYHTHTPLCLHAVGEPEDFVARALQLSLSDYGISDHMPMPRDDFDNWRMADACFPEYLAWIGRAREAAKGTDLRILAGMECDWLPGIGPWLQELRGRYAWDYLIGSVHYLTPEAAVDGDECAGHSITDSDAEDWRLYGLAVADMVRSGLFDIVGHMDLVKVWGRRPAADVLPYIAPALEALENSRMAVELNTAGWHKKCAEQYPGAPVLQELLRRGIPIVINSDAHDPGHLSRDWEKGLRLLDNISGGRLCPCTHTTSAGTILHAFALQA